VGDSDFVGLSTSIHFGISIFSIFLGVYTTGELHGTTILLKLKSAVLRLLGVDARTQLEVVNVNLPPRVLDGVDGIMIASSSGLSLSESSSTTSSSESSSTFTEGGINPELRWFFLLLIRALHVMKLAIGYLLVSFSRVGVRVISLPLPLVFLGVVVGVVMGVAIGVGG
jgi:hypothetical protein